MGGSPDITNFIQGDCRAMALFSPTLAEQTSGTHSVLPSELLINLRTSPRTRSRQSGPHTRARGRLIPESEAVRDVQARQPRQAIRTRPNTGLGI
jgi:hypothetical protein